MCDRLGQQDVRSQGKRKYSRNIKLLLVLSGMRFHQRPKEVQESFYQCVKSNESQFGIYKKKSKQS